MQGCWTEGQRLGLRLMAAGLGLAAIAVLAACGSSNPPARFPTVPVDNLLDTASQPAFRTADHQSFAKAVLEIPADGGLHRVPVGEYLLSRLVESFPERAEVDNLRLVSFASRCNDAGWFSSTLVCDVAADIQFRLYKRPQAVSVRLSEKDFGGLEKARQGGSFTVARPEEAKRDPFAQQVRAIPDAIATRFRQELQPILIESQRRLAF